MDSRGAEEKKKDDAMWDKNRLQYSIEKEAPLLKLRHISTSSQPSLFEDFGVLPSGSRYKVARLRDCATPMHALIFCHGFRPAGIPLAAPFCANDNPHGPVYVSLMREKNFLVASVSYRREGVIYADAVEDVMEMYTLLKEHYGINGSFLVQGRSMGGAIGTLLNERYGDKFAGILTLGAALHVSPETTDGKKPVFSHVPKTNQIFLTNVSEIAVVETYVKQCTGGPRPLIFTLNRFGHCACFDSELAFAFDQLWEWIQSGKRPLQDVVDATSYADEPRDDLAWWDEERRGYWSPLSVTMYYTLSFPMTEANWRRLNIKPRSKFVCEFHTESGVTQRELAFHVDPFVGVEPGTLMAYVKSVGQSSGIGFHSTGTSLNTAAKELHIRREGNAIFIPEQNVGVPRAKKTVAILASETTTIIDNT